MHMLYSNPQTENLEKHYADIQAKLIINKSASTRQSVVTIRPHSPW